MWFVTNIIYETKLCNVFYVYETPVIAYININSFTNSSMSSVHL